MKIIDLLNKIANGEEVPKKIKYDGIEYEEEPCYMLYETIGECSESQLKNLLNDQVEIIEEDKKIEKLDIMSDEATPNSYYILNEHGTKCYLTKHSKVIADRVNLLIDKINNMENKQ